VIKYSGAVVGRRLDKAQQQACIIELAIMIRNPSSQSFLSEVRDRIQGLITVQDLCCAEIPLPGEQTIQLEADSVISLLPPLVSGDYEAEAADQVGSVLQEQSPFSKGFHHQRDISLLQVPDASVQ
jgi:hypothetical protein